MADLSGQLGQLVFDSLPHAVLVTGCDGGILLRNGRACRDLPGGEMFCEAVVPGGPPEDLDFGDLKKQLAQAGGSWVLRSIWVYHRQGNQFLADVYVQQLPNGDSDGQANLLLVIQDVSQRAMIERRLAASERLAALGYLSQKVAHELNNPMDGIYRYLGLAQRTCDEQTGGYIAKARSGLDRMSGVIRDLAEQGMLGSHGEQRAPLGLLIEESLSAMQQKLQANQIQVHRDLQGTESRRVDGNLFHVFCNLIRNALDEMQEGGLLEVTAWQGGQMLYIDFADTGGGFASEIPKQIFEPFFTTKAVGSGSGLGLAICRELIKRMGGQIHASNRPEGGARVTVSVPLDRSAPEPAGPDGPDQFMEKQA